MFFKSFETAPAGAVVNHFGSWEWVAQPTTRASGFFPAAPLAEDSTKAAAPSTYWDAAAGGK